MRIFIVEDDNVLLLMLERIISRMGHEVVGKATKGADAIDNIPGYDPDLILMDIILKDDIDGIMVAEKIKKIKNYPIIYITGNSDKINIERAKVTGYHDYLIKPTSYQELEASIKRLNSDS